MTYAYGENYCYMPAPFEMKKLYAENKIGELEYAECEYLHNCESIWPCITYGERDHWRNNMYSTFYCTHSLGPILHATGLRPVSVIGIEPPRSSREIRMGKKSAAFGIEMVTLENGATVKSIHGSLYNDSVWFSMYGSKGRMESGREDMNTKHIGEIFIKSDEVEAAYDMKFENYEPKREFDHLAEEYGHGGSDFYCMYHFVEKLRGNKDADIIDVYEALDMFLAGMFAYRSILDGNKPKEVPNLRDKSIRDQWRNDTACTDPKVAGDMLLPTHSTGTPEVDDAVYARMKKLWDEECSKEGAKNYRATIFQQGGLS